MKNLLSKSLLCGVLASTFLIVNCQKAPNRAVKAEVTPSAKPAAAKTAECTEDALKELRLLTEKNEVLKASIARVDAALKTEKEKVAAAQKKYDEAAAGADKDAALKVLDEAKAALKALTDKSNLELTQNVNDLKKQSDAAIAKIKSIKIGDKQEEAQACTDDKRAVREVRHIQDTMLKIGKDIKDKTGLDNDASKAAPVLDNKIEQNDELTLTEALAKLLADESQKDKAVISEGKILTAEADMKKALENKGVTSCKVSTYSADVKDVLVKDVKAEVSAIAKDDTTKETILSLGVKGTTELSMSLISLTCKIAEGKDANVELRTALGSLVSAVKKAEAKPEAKKRRS